MADLVVTQEAVRRLDADGLPVSEYTLRRWIKQGIIPVRRIGTKALIFYPALVRYLRCEDETIGGNNGK